MDQLPRPVPVSPQRGGPPPDAITADEEDHTTRLLRRKFEALAPFLDERMRRLWAGAEAKALGRGGITAVARATGFSRATIRVGIQELEVFQDDLGRVANPRPTRRPAAGQPVLADIDPTLLDNLDHLVLPPPRESGPSALRWTCESTARLAVLLSRAGHRVTSATVARGLRQLGYELRCPHGSAVDREQASRKAQFESLRTQVQDFLRRGQPVIAVDGTRTEGAFFAEHPTGRIPQMEGARPVPAPRPAACPGNDGNDVPGFSWESLTADGFLAELSLECVGRWWRHMGREAFPAATELLLAADVGGTGSGDAAFQGLLQGLAEEIGLPLRVSHHPPGTSKWTRTRHQTFCTFVSALPGPAPATYTVRLSVIGDAVAAQGPASAAKPDGPRIRRGVAVRGEEVSPPPQEGGEQAAWNRTFVPHRTPAPVSPDHPFGPPPVDVPWILCSG
jgi:hypothetical protein